MVRIHRPPTRIGQGRNSGKAGGLSSLLTCRNLILALVALQVTSLTVKFLTSDSTAIPPPTPDGAPQGMLKQLKESHSSLRQNSNQQQQHEPQPGREPPIENGHNDHDNSNPFADLHKQQEKHDQENGDVHHGHPELPDENDLMQNYEHVIDPDDENKQEPDLPHEEIHGGKEEHPTVQKQPKKGSAIHDIVLEKTGTGPTKVGYIKDFVHEQAHPEFRKESSSNVDDHRTTEEDVAKLAQETSVKSCLSGDGTKRIMDPKCLDTDTALIVYNPGNFPRTWCGSTDILPKTATQLKQGHCDPTFATEPVHIFASSSTMEGQFASISGQGMPSIIVKSHDETVMAESDLETVECNISCKQEKGMEGTLRFIDGQHEWKITQTLLDSWNNQEATIDRTDYRFNHYYSTQSFLSSVPLTVFDFDKYNLRNRPAVSWDTAENKAIYLVNTACSSLASKRNKYFHATAAVYKVDAIGACHHNTDVPDGHSIETSEGRINLMKQYRMVLAFDANKEKDHISQIVWEAFVSGAVPVVVGAENMRDHMPPHSMVFSGDYKDWDELAEAVKTIANDKTMWESYHAWRTDEAALKKFEEKYEFTKSHPTCRMCRWAYAKMYGLGWDQATQQIQEPNISRNLCVQSDAPQLVSSPFEESYVARFDTEEIMINQEVQETCTEKSAPETATIQHDAFKIHRTVSRHDGLADIVVTGIEREHDDGEISLRLDLPLVRNSQGAFFRNPHTLTVTASGYRASSGTIQDEHTKVTVLADWVTEISSPQEGVLEVVLLTDKEGPMAEGETRRIRVITEDTSELHDKMTEFFPSSFARLATEDFIDPLEVYYADA